jgi:hypothetical protein
MATYRAYRRDQYGNAIAPPMIFDATNDLVAIAQAMQAWHEGQRVGTVVRSKSAAVS